MVNLFKETVLEFKAQWPNAGEVMNTSDNPKSDEIHYHHFLSSINPLLHVRLTYNDNQINASCQRGSGIGGYDIESASFKKLADDKYLFTKTDGTVYEAQNTDRVQFRLVDQMIQAVGIDKF